MSDFPSTNDHDLLIQAVGKLNDIAEIAADVKELSYRVRASEEKDTRHSEKIKAIAQEKIDAHASLERRIEKLETKSNIWDTLNSFGLLVSAYIGYYFGHR